MINLEHKFTNKLFLSTNLSIDQKVSGLEMYLEKKRLRMLINSESASETEATEISQLITTYFNKFLHMPETPEILCLSYLIEYNETRENYVLKCIYKISETEGFGIISYVMDDNFKASVVFDNDKTYTDLF